MFEYLNERPFLVLIVGVVIVFVLMFIFVKPGKKKKKTTDKKEKHEKVSTDKVEENTKDESKVVVPDEVKETDSVDGQTTEIKKKKKVHKSSQKPEVTQVYKRTTSIIEGGSEKPAHVLEEESRLDNLEKRAQFVKSSNKVSKFVGWSDIVEDEVQAMEAMVQDEFYAEENNEPCEICQDTSARHFDHSRRLSKMIQDDSFDDMLQAHISEKYLNFNSGRHLSLTSDFEERLYERALKTLSNGDVKVLVDDEKHDVPVEQLRNDKAFMREWLEDRKRAELSKLMTPQDEIHQDDFNEEFAERVKNDIDLSPKNIVVVDALLKRKGRKKR